MKSQPARALVSIVIPTYKRKELLKQTFQNIAEQDYENLEVIPVIEGEDEDSKWVCTLNIFNWYTLRSIRLGRNWSSLDHSSFGIAPLLVGYLAASGTYIMPWCDDERAMTPDHITKLVNLIEQPNKDGFMPDFVYPKVHIWRKDDPTGPEATDIGTDPPQYGQITHYLFRYDNFIRFGYPDFGSHPLDWSLIRKWMTNDATWAMLDEVTFSHRLDQ